MICVDVTSAKILELVPP